MMMHHYPDLDGASYWSYHVGNLLQPIRSTTEIWVVMHHQDGISALDSQMSFWGETSSGFVKCPLFSQAIIFNTTNYIAHSHKILSNQSDSDKVL